MKNSIKYIFLIVIILLSTLTISSNTSNTRVQHIIPVYKDTTTVKKRKRTVKPVKTIYKVSPSNKAFLLKLAKLESNNDYRKISKRGYIGKYQFGKIAFKDMGVSISVEDFKQNPDSIFSSSYQDQFCIKYMKRNKSILKKHFKIHKDSVYNEIRITEAGMLASAHLLGAGNVIKYLESKGKYDPVDGNGVHLSLYMSKFQNITIKI